MGMTNVGTQYIGWKYSTPLQADYLDTFLAGFSSPGLFVRPNITPNGAASSNGQTFTIHPFSLLIEPNDKKLDKNTDANGKRFIQKLVKISMTEVCDINVPINACAIGFYYDFSNNLIPQAQWYGDIVVLDSESITTFEGIIIATVQHHQVGETHYISVTTSGADISDALLIEEGWDPNCWLSVISPRRTIAMEGGKIKLNKLEIRKHNDVYSNNEPMFISGAGGIKSLNDSNTIYTFIKDSASSNPDGTRGFMPAKWNAFSIHSGVNNDGSNTGLMPKTWDGVNSMDCGNTLPITRQSGNIFAIVDATATIDRLPESSFVNKLKIYPVHTERYNIYYYDKTLFIK